MIPTAEYLAIGAESIISKVQIWGNWYVMKSRPSKAYLHPDLDQHLRASRTSRECKGLNFARALGVPTPAIYWVSLTDFSILMDLVPGKQLKTVAPKIGARSLRMLCKRFGQLIAKLHSAGMVHGDPTTSNLLIGPNDEMWMIDFGLSEMNATVEMKGVDLHLVKRALETTHWDLQDEMLSSTLEGYVEELGDEAEDAIERMREIRERGRYH